MLHEPIRIQKKHTDVTCVNPVSPNSDQHQISPHQISVLQRIKVMRIEEMITKDELS